jgi:hypothetical protein
VLVCTRCLWLVGVEVGANGDWSWGISTSSDLWRTSLIYFCFLLKTDCADAHDYVLETTMSSTPTTLLSQLLRTHFGSAGRRHASVITTYKTDYAYSMRTQLCAEYANHAMAMPHALPKYRKAQPQRSLIAFSFSYHPFAQRSLLPILATCHISLSSCNRMRTYHSLLVIVCGHITLFL